MCGPFHVCSGTPKPPDSVDLVRTLSIIIMTHQEYAFYKQNKLDEKGYDICHLVYYDDEKLIYGVDMDIWAFQDIATGKVEIREFTQEEAAFFNKFTDDEMDNVMEYTHKKGYGPEDEAFYPLMNLEAGKMLWYVAKINPITDEVEAEEFIVTRHTRPLFVVEATEDELQEFDEYLLYCDNEVRRVVEEDENIERAELASVFEMKYKLYPDQYLTDENGKKHKSCLLFDQSDTICQVAGMTVDEMEKDIFDPLNIACRKAVQRRLKAYKAKQE